MKKSWLLTRVVLIVAVLGFPGAGTRAQAAPASTPCPGPAICGKSCSLDRYGTPIYCSNAHCDCAPGYDTVSDPGGGLVCQPQQPEVTGSESDDYACPGLCASAAPWATVGSIYKAFDLVPVHGTAPGGEAFMPVWGYQATHCGDHGVAATDADGHPIRTWAGCAPDPRPFCHGIQDCDEGDFNYNNCEKSEGCGNSACVSDFTDAWPFLDAGFLCKFDIGHDSDPSRIDFPNSVAVYRARIQWEDHSVPDDDYTMNLHSPGHELYDSDTYSPYQGDGGRVHVEYDSDDSVDHFTDDDWGAANRFWRDLRNVVDNAATYGDDNDQRNVRCFLKSFVNAGLTFDLSTLTCSEDAAMFDRQGSDGLRDPLAVVVGVPGLDCHDNDTAGTDEIHPAYAVAIRIQEDPSQPEQWAFFYRNRGNNGFCGTVSYARCLSTFQLPLGLPVVPTGKVLTSADVNVDWHPWTQDDSAPSDVTLDGSFDLANGTMLTIRLPHAAEGVVGLATVTPHFDTTPPTITCPANITNPVDLGKCTAAITFTPMSSDNCAVNATVCTSPSGSAFPIGTTTDTCTATDQAGLTASCSFNVTVTAGNKCRQGEGYWKNHTDLWAVDSLTLGSATYSKPQLISILTSPGGGDASVILAKQLIAALLNLAGGSNPVPICGTIADANSALDGCTIPCGTGPKSTVGQQMISDANTLDAYSSGKLTASCAP